MKRTLFTFSTGILLLLSACKPPNQAQADKAQNKNLSATTLDHSKDKGFKKVIQLTNAFKATLTAEQLALVQLSYTKTDAAKWSNFPASFRGAKRVGLSFGAMTPDQIQAAKNLLKEVAGTHTNEGWDELQQLLNADDYLKVNGGGSDYGKANYYIAFLGEPSDSGTFEIQFGGHHLAFANTYKKGVLVGATPSFRGVEPFGNFAQNGENNQPMNQEQIALSAMLKGLSENELAAAKLNATYSDLLVGPQRDGAFPTKASGIKVGSLSAGEKALVLAAINTYVDDIDDTDAKLFLDKYKAELDDTYISYSGTTSMIDRNDYVRIDGPSVWIEYSSQHGIILPGTHPHSVWRDKSKDYGGN